MSSYCLLYVITADLPTNIVDFRGFDSSIILILRGGILMSMGDFPESLGQAMLVGVMLVGRLGVLLLFQAAGAVPAERRQRLEGPDERGQPHSFLTLLSLLSLLLLLVVVVVVVLVLLCIIIVICVFYLSVRCLRFIDCMLYAR